MEQMDFNDVEIQEKQARIRFLAAEVDRRLKAVALTVDRHRLATLNDKSYSYISEILNTNNEDGQKPFQIKFIPSLLIERPEEFKSQVIDFLCELTGYLPPKKKSLLTPEEELCLYRKIISEHGLEPIFKKHGELRHG